VPNTQQGDVLWIAIDWAVKGAGALLAVILTFSWKDYREKAKQITELEKHVAVLQAEVKSLQGDRRG
jgi:hypothetical protein